MRSFLLGAKTEVQSWTNPYVTDGLVAYWDGEWNAGGGKHDAGATALKDLVGSNDASLVVGSIESNCIVGSAGVLAQCSSAMTFAFCEAVFMTNFFDAGASGACAPVFKGSSQNPQINIGYQFGDSSRYTAMFKFQRGASIPAPWGRSLSVSASDNSIYVDGVQLSIVNQDGWGNNNYTVPTFGGQMSHGGTKPFFSGKIYCVRCYSRALTAEEIAANYAIDARRFGL